VATSYYHAISSAKRFGGKPQDYVPIHDWFDRTKYAWADVRHRCILHSTFGIQLCVERFGIIIVVDNKNIPTRLIAEQHVKEDCGFIPTIQDWLSELPMKDWMRRGAQKLSKELTTGESNGQE